MSDQDFSPEAPSFDEFAIPTYEEWYAAAVESLKGASFDKLLVTPLYEGLTIQPVYRQEDIADLPHIHSLPGFPPFVRGTQASGYLRQPWHVAQAIAYASPAAGNEALRHDLERGQTAISMIIANPLSESSRAGEVHIHTLDDLAQLFQGIELTRYPLLIEAGTNALPVAALLAACAHHRNLSLADLQGSIGPDPLAQLVQEGTLPLPLESAYDEMALLTSWAAEHAPRLAAVTVSTVPYHNSGGHAVQELAFALAAGVDYLRALLARSLDLETIAPRMQFTFAIGGHFFVEVAKLRAARLLWAQVIAAFGGSEAVQQMKIASQTGMLNKTAYDAHTNLLRTTMEAFAGALGGADSLQIAPFDSITGAPDEFSRRVARNQQLILQHEVNLPRLLDPAGGSWYIETLTDELARRAWSLFQEVEDQGGLFRALQSGSPQTQVQQVAAQRMTNMERRKEVLVGINIYPDLKQSAPQPTVAAPTATSVPPSTADAADALDQLRSAPPQTRMEAAIRAALAGATLSDMASSLRASSTDEPPAVTPLAPLRLAEPFETLRQRAEAYRSQAGHLPRIFLANIGNYRARADFTTGFFEAGGFEILNQGRYDSPEQAAQAAADSGAQAVVICSTDDQYPQIVPPLVSQIKAHSPQTIVILAGYPQDQIEAHRAAGIDEFIHLRANCYQINRWLQLQMGIDA